MVQWETAGNSAEYFISLQGEGTKPGIAAASHNNAAKLLCYTFNIEERIKKL